MASPTGKSFAFAYSEAEKRNKPKGFWATLGENVAKGAATAFGTEVASQLINIPVESYTAGQKESADRFVNTEEVFDSTRKNELVFAQLEELKDAAIRAEQTGVTLNEARANMPSVITAADNMLMQNDQFNSAAFDPAERLRISKSYRQKAVEKNSAAYDKFLIEANGVTDPTDLKALARRSYSRNKSIFKNLFTQGKGWMKGVSAEDLALEYYKNTPEFQKSLEAGAAMDELTKTKNGNKTLRALITLERSSLSGEFQGTFKTTATDTKTVQRGTGWVDETTVSVENMALGTITSTTTEVPNSFRTTFSNSDFLVSDMYTLINKVGFVTGARSQYLEASRKEVADTVGLVRNTATGKDEEYDIGKANQYTTSDGLAAQNIYLKNLGVWAEQPRNFVDDAKQKAAMMGTIAKALQEYQINFGTVKAAYDKNTMEKDGKIFALNKNGIIMKDQTTEVAQGLIRQRRTAQGEIAAIKNLFAENYKISLGVQNNLIDIKSNLVIMDIGGNQKTLPKLTPLPKLALGIGKIEVDGEVHDQFIFPKNVPIEVQQRNTDIFLDWEAGVVPAHGGKYISPRTLQREKSVGPSQKPKQDATQEGVKTVRVDTKDQSHLKKVGLALNEVGLTLNDEKNILLPPVKPVKPTSSRRKAMGKEVAALYWKDFETYTKQNEEFEKILARVNERPEKSTIEIGRPRNLRGPSPFNAKINRWERTNTRFRENGIPTELLKDILKDYLKNPNSILTAQN